MATSAPTVMADFRLLQKGNSAPKWIDDENGKANDARAVMSSDRILFLDLAPMKVARTRDSRKNPGDTDDGRPRRIPRTHESPTIG